MILQILTSIYWIVRALIVDRLELAFENLACRQQLAAYEREGKRPRIEPFDRILWAFLCVTWSKWTSALISVNLQR